MNNEEVGHLKYLSIVIYFAGETAVSPPGPATPPAAAPPATTPSARTPSTQSVSPPGTPRVLDPTWFEQYEVTFSNLPAPLKKAFLEKKRPSPKDRRQMVRIIVDDIVKLCPNPKSPQLSAVARKLCLRYPVSFRDEFDSSPGLSHEIEGLTKQLRARVENVNRGNPLTSRRVLIPTQQAANGEEIPAAKRKAADSYGCVNWQPQLPEEETEAAQMNKKEAMQKLYAEGKAVYIQQTATVEELMDVTYPFQRKCINGPPVMPIYSVRDNWPFLFEPRYLFRHFEELVGIKITEVIPEALRTKVPRFMAYYRGIGGKSKQPLQEIIRRLDDALRHCDDRQQCEAFGFFLLSQAYFGEKDSKIFFKADVSTECADY